MIIAKLAASLLQLDQRVQGLDRQIAATFRRHHQAMTIESMPGFGPILGAQLLVAAGDLRAYPGAGHLAAAAGLVPVPNDSGRRSGNLHKPAPLQPTAAARLLSVRANQRDVGGSEPCLLPQETRWRPYPRPSRHHLARRRIDVLWALLRDDRTFSVDPTNLAAAA
jgi:Transposase IS116/IS110/IS902 family